MEIRLDGPGILSLLRSFDRLCVFHEFQDVAALGTCIADGSGRKFKHGVRGKTPGNPPRRNTIPDFLYSMFPVEIDEIDRKPHEEGVDSFAGNDPQSLSFAEPLSAKKSLGTLGPASCHLKLVGDLRVPGQISNRHSTIAPACFRTAPCTALRIRRLRFFHLSVLETLKTALGSSIQTRRVKKRNDPLFSLFYAK